MEESKKNSGRVTVDFQIKLLDEFLKEDVEQFWQESITEDFLEESLENFMKESHEELLKDSPGNSLNVPEEFL